MSMPGSIRGACLACRQRKSRCTFDPGFPAACLMCRSHDTPCEFVPRKKRARLNTRRAGSPPRAESLASPGHGRLPSNATRFTSPNPKPLSGADTPEQPLLTSGSPLSSIVGPTQLLVPEPERAPYASEEHDGQNAPTLDSPGDDSSNQRLVAPIVDSDSHVLSEIYSCRLGGHRTVRTVWTHGANEPSKATVFTETRRRPVGLTSRSSPSCNNLEIIQKFLEPHLFRLIDIFMSKVNPCFPLLDEAEFRRRYSSPSCREKISPALLCCIYAHALTYWTSDSVLAGQNCPDQRFIWNLASEALYSEMRLCPGLHTLVAIVLNASGRPTSLVFNNVGQLGFAISIAFTLGLNRDPSTWDIPSHEKCLRKNVWRALLICDRWSSLAYGIPPRILNTQSDMPPPSIVILDASSQPTMQQRVAVLFCALADLTEVLNDYLQALYESRQLRRSPAQLPFPSSLQDWKDSTSGDLRRIVFRGSDLTTPGAANLRFLFLSVQFLHHRVCLENQRGSAKSTDTQALRHSYITTREAAEEVVIFLQEIGDAQRTDFWLPHVAFLLSYIMSFLLRSALEQEYEVTGPTGCNGALALATDLMTALRAHTESGSWDLGEVCIVQYSDILIRIREMDNDRTVNSIDWETWNALVSDVSFEDNILFTTMGGIL